MRVFTRPTTAECACSDTATTSPAGSGWFEGLTITLKDNGDTLLTGPVVDQAALHGLLRKVRDLGIPLLSVNRVEPGQADASEVKE